MNLFLKSYKFYLLFLLAECMYLPFSLGQGNPGTYKLIPEVYNFSIPTAYNRSPNTSFVRNDQGIVFIGKENGLLTIDQDQHFFTPFDEPVYVTRTSNDRIAYLTSNDFGFIRYDIATGVILQSRIKSIETHFHNFFPSDAASFGSSAFLATSEGVFWLNDSTTEQLFFQRRKLDLHEAGDQLLLEVERTGIFRWTGSEFSLIISAEALNSEPVSSVVDWRDGLVLFTEKGNTFFYNLTDGSLSNGHHPGDSFGHCRLIRNLFSNHSLAQNINGELCIYSADNAAVIPLSEQDNMPSSELRNVFTDRFNDTWIIFSFNIYKIEYPSRSYILDLSDLIRGTILATAIRDDQLFLGTDDGLLMIRPGDPAISSGLKIAGLNRGYFHLLQYRDNLLVAAGNEGLYELEGTVPVMVAEGNFSSVSILSNHTMIGCSNDGLQHFKKSNGGEWETEVLSDTVKRIHSAAVSQSGCWLQTGNNAILHLRKEGLRAVRIHNLPNDSLRRLVVIDDRLLLLGEKGVYGWNETDAAFEKIRISYLSKQLLSSDLVISSKDKLWSVSRNAGGGSTIWLLGDDLIRTPFFEIMGRKAFGQVVDIEENRQHIWITGSKKVMRLDTASQQFSGNDLLRIQSVRRIPETDAGSTILVKPSQKIPFRKNRIVIDLADTRYLSDPAPYYRYKLNNYQENWSEWSASRQIELGRLMERKYTFTAQSVSAFGRLSEPVTFDFTIKAPFYRKWYAFLFYTLTLFIVAFLVYKWRLLSLKKVEHKLEEQVKERIQSVLSEKEKSDKLVADLFPKGTAEEIKSKGRAESKKFEMATILFSDIQGFTKIAEEMNPEMLIDELDKFFFHFDSVVEKYNIEKIKTIGDAYMAAGGIPVKNSSNPVEVVLAGLEMQYYMKDLKRKKTDIWDLRIGIHSGPVITGVVGHKKLSYDIWGDTVNTASRMESSGEGGKVNISGITYALVKDFFICEYRGKLPVKYKGNIDMYFVTGLRPELSVDLQGIPNRRFFTKLQMLKLQDIEERVMEMVYTNETFNLHFHKKALISKVAFQTELLGRAAELSDDEMLLTQVAALLLYSGLSDTYENFEGRSIEIAREILPEYGFDERQTERICNLILSTKAPFEPQNNLEEILIDAKMEFLGRSDYLTQIKLLYLEMKNNSNDFSREQFIRQQGELLKGFDFFTVAARRLREVSPEDQLRNLESWK